MTQGPVKTLADLGPGGRGKIAQYAVGADSSTLRLIEMGLLPGETVIVEHEAPLGRDPMAVWVRGGIVALRRREARSVRLEASL